VRSDGVANRERILLCAEELFEAKGASASTEEIARRAGVGVATVFRHFPAKQDLIEATVIRFLNHLEVLSVRLAVELDDGAAFTRLVRSLVSTGAAKLTLSTLLMTDGRGLTEPVLAASRGFQDAVRRVLERAQAAGTARPDVTVEEVFVLIQGLAHVTDPDAEAVRDRALNIVLDGLAMRH